MFTRDVEQKGQVSPQGLTRQEAETRLRQYGRNAVREGFLRSPLARPCAVRLGEGPRVNDFLCCLLDAAQFTWDSQALLSPRRSAGRASGCAAGCKTAIGRHSKS